MFYRVIRNRKGITLIELIISMAILTIIIGVMFGQFLFGSRVFARGTSQRNVQADVRLAADYVTQRARFATELAILSLADITSYIASPSTIPAYENYLYVDSSTGSLVHINKIESKSIKLGDSGNLTFTSIDPFETLVVEVEGTNNSRTYKVESELYTINLPLGGSVIDGTASGTPPTISDSVLKFKTVNDYIAESIFPIAEMKGTNNKNTVEITYNKVLYATGHEILSNIGCTASISKTGDYIATISVSNAHNGDTVEFKVSFDDTSSFTCKIALGTGNKWIFV